MCLGLAQAYQAMFDSTQRPQGKRTLNLTMWQQTCICSNPSSRHRHYTTPENCSAYCRSCSIFSAFLFSPEWISPGIDWFQKSEGWPKVHTQKLLYFKQKKPIKVIYGLDNSAISTCSSLHRWSSVECILLLKLSWRYWESWLRVKEMSKPSSSAKLSAMNTECTGEQREDLSFTSQSLASSAVIFNFPWNCIQT